MWLSDTNNMQIRTWSQNKSVHPKSHKKHTHGFVVCAVIGGQSEMERKSDSVFSFGLYLYATICLCFHLLKTAPHSSSDFLLS